MLPLIQRRYKAMSFEQFIKIYVNLSEENKTNLEECLSDLEEQPASPETTD